MSVAERVFDLAREIEKCVDDPFIALHLDEARKLIEQALLAERKSVWEEAAKMCEAMSSDKWKRYKIGRSPERANMYTQGESDAAGNLAMALRAAAEKEVGTK